MSYRYDTQKLNPQQQAIIRKRDEEDRKRREENERKLKEKLSEDIIEVLRVEGKPLTLDEIAKKLNVLSGPVLTSLNSIPHKLIKRELEDKSIVYEIK